MVTTSLPFASAAFTFPKWFRFFHGLWDALTEEVDGVFILFLNGGLEKIRSDFINVCLRFCYHLVVGTMFENHRKSITQYCERSELRLHFEWTIVYQKCQKWSILESFWKPEACGQTVLPARSVLIGQKLVENAKIQKFKYGILGDFQTMWRCQSVWVDDI